MANPWDKPQAKNPWDKPEGAELPAGLPAGQDLPQLPAHPSANMQEAPRVLADSRFGKRLDSNVSGLITPMMHPVKSALSHPDFADPGQQGDAISTLRANPSLGGVSDVLADAVTAGTIGAVSHAAPAIAAPIAEGLKAGGGKLYDLTAGLHLKDIRHGAEPGRAYLEGGGTPAFTMAGLAEKAANVKSATGQKIGTAYDEAGKAGVRIPAADVLNEVSEPISKLRTLKQSAGGTGITPEMVTFEDSLMPPIGKAALRGGFSPTELFSEMKKPISDNTRWNDPTMYDLNKVRQQTVGKIGGLLTDAVPETARLNKIYQGSGNFAKRAQMRADTGQSPLSAIGRRATEAAAGTLLGHELNNPFIAALPILADTVPVKTGLGYSLFQGGRALPPIAEGIRSVVPLTTPKNRRRPVEP